MKSELLKAKQLITIQQYFEIVKELAWNPLSIRIHDLAIKWAFKLVTKFKKAGKNLRLTVNIVGSSPSHDGNNYINLGRFHVVISYLKKFSS